MKQRNGVIPRLVLAFTLVAMVATAVSAQELNGQWYKVNFACTSKAVNESGNFTDYNFSFNVYVYFIYNGPGTDGALSSYDVEFWSQVAPDVWEMTFMDSGAETSPYSENFFPDMQFMIGNKAGTEIEGYITPHVGLEPGGFRAGGEVYGGEDAQGRSLYGWVLVKGTRVNSVPFSIKESSGMSGSASGPAKGHK